ncbi:MAG: glycosyltransferase [Ignavibacteria bacterium]|nr:glycosyltransferase [Ignavibacteria bacterium]
MTDKIILQKETDLKIQLTAGKNLKYKICIVSAILPPAYGGAEVAAFKYAQRLERDPESDILVIGWDRTGGYKDSKIKYDFVVPVSLRENPKDAKGILIYFQQYYHMWKCFIKLFSPMWKYRKDYDYIHNFNSGFAFNRVSILIGKILGKKIVTETSLVGDDDPLSLGRFLDWKDYLKPKFIRYLFYKMADRYVSKSNVITEIYRKSEISMNKVVQIPYSVDVNKFYPPDAKRKMMLRHKFNIDENDIVVIFVGGINSRKNVHLLLNSFIEIQKNIDSVKLLIVGPTYKYDQEYISELKSNILENSIEGKVLFTEDNVSNVEEYMQSSDIFVLPSKQEGFPISIIEAMSCGLAVIGSDIPVISKAQIVNGVDGFVFPLNDPDKLTEILKKLILKKEEIKKIGNEAREKALKYWSDEIVDEKYKKLYSSINYELPLNNYSRQDAKKETEKIKILYTIPNFNTAGSGKALINVISRLDRNVFEPCICCRHERGDLFSQVKDLNIPVYISEFTVSTKPRIKGLKNVLKLSRNFKNIDPDIIHSYNYSDDYSEALASKLGGIKWVYTKKNMGWGSNGWKIRTNLSSAIIPQNREMVETFFNGIKEQYLIPIGIDIQEFDKTRRDESIITKYQLYNSNPIIITVANVIPIKGIDYLIRGFELILEDYENAKLLIIGDDVTDYAKELKRKTYDAGMEGKVIFTGKQKDIKPFFSIADMFILSSKKTGEGGPISILEAMASGIICYGSDVPGIRDQFRELEDQLFESENPGSIANKIMNYMRMRDDIKRDKISKQLEFVKKYYSIENEVDKLQKLYLKISKK